MCSLGKIYWLIHQQSHYQVKVCNTFSHHRPAVHLNRHSLSFRFEPHMDEHVTFCKLKIKPPYLQTAFEMNYLEWLTHESCRNDVKIMSTVEYSQVGFISLVHACMIIIHACVRCGPIEARNALVFFVCSYTPPFIHQSLFTRYLTRFIHYSIKFQ